MSIIEMRVHMDCAGCETKIKKALKKLKGVDDVDTDIFLQKVTVMGWADRKKILKTVRKTGKRAELWPYPYNPEYYYNNPHNPEYHYNNNNDTQQYYHNQYVSEPKPVMTFYHRPPKPSSSYNYYKHGYDYSYEHGSYQPPLYSTLIDPQASSVFSDENVHACSIM